jgi:hypothetical protein
MTTGTSSIRPGVVVRDPHRKTGIVCSKEPVPAQDWIDGLVHSADVKMLGPTDWWGVLALDGGYLLVPGPLLTYLRDATYDDFLEAADSANPAGREALLTLFPHYVERLLASRRSAESGE